MATAKSDATGYLISREADGARGIPLNSGWYVIQPNPDGITGHEAQFVDVVRNPLSTFATDEKPDHAGFNAKPGIVHDLTKDLADRFGDGWTRSVAKVPGNKGVAIYYPTAVVDGGVSNDSFTVPASGDLTDGLLVETRGFINAANNGVFKLSGGSVAGSTKVATGLLVAEAVAVVGAATLEVCGVEGAAADITLDGNGDLTSTILDFTQLNLVDGHEIKVGDTAAGTRFATAAYNGWANVNGVVTAHKIPLKWRSWTPGAQDLGAGKTIRLFFGRCYRNVATTHADYREPSWSAEKEDQNVGAAGAPVFTLVKGMSLNQASFAMPVKSKIVVTQNFEAMDIGDPADLVDRIVGPSTAQPAVAMELFNTANELVELAAYKVGDGSTLTAEVNSFTLTIDHNVDPQDQLATFGAADMNFGKIRPKGQAEVYYRRATMPRTIRSNETCRLTARLRNGQAGMSFHLPSITLRGGAMKYSENKPVMVSLEMPAHRDPTTNQVLVVNVMPYVPAT